MLEHTQECLGIHGDAYELLGIPRNAQDHMWKPSGQLGVLINSFGCLWEVISPA